MRVLITGGAGFLGSALANRLHQDGHEVRVLDDLSSGDESQLRPGIAFTRGNVLDVPRLWTLLHGVECVYHLAARVHVPESLQYPSQYNDVNVGGTVRVLEAMRDVGVKRVVLTSSGAVYGEQAQQPVREDMAPNPQSPYAVSKLAAEYYVRTIGMLWGIEAVCLRIFNAYGPGQPLRASFPPVIPSFISRIQTGGSVIIHGDGRATRDYVYIDDVVEALAAALTAPNIDRRVINVGSGVETSIVDLMHMVERVTGKEARPLNSRTSSGASRLCADLSLARELLGYEPRISLEEGLRLTVSLDPRFSRQHR
ncbi:MAG: SDR family NAD(P)-dependent oxidoreductase [Anaerolineae bacterium]